MKCYFNNPVELATDDFEFSEIDCEVSVGTFGRMADYVVTGDGGILDKEIPGSPNGFYFEVGIFSDQPYYQRQDTAFTIAYETRWVIGNDFDEVTAFGLATEVWLGSDTIEGIYEPIVGVKGNPVVAGYTNTIYELITNVSSPDREFYVQKTFTYGEGITIWFLTLFTIFIIAKTIFNFFWKK